MGKSSVYIVMGISTVAVVIAAVTLIVFLGPDVHIEDILAVYQDEAEYSGLTILYPLNETLFPPEIVFPTFRWEDDKSGSDTWLITINFRDNNGRMSFLTSKQQFRPGTNKRMGGHKETLPGERGGGYSAGRKSLGP